MENNVLGYFFQYDEVWAAADTPLAVFRVTPDHLLTITEGQVIQVK